MRSEKSRATRCAVYTRVSTEHGLEQEFNSLDNQREASEAYLARHLLQRRAIGRHRLLEPRRPALPLAEPIERVAEIALRRRPVERHAFARPFLQRRAIGRAGSGGDGNAKASRISILT